MSEKKERKIFSMIAKYKGYIFIAIISIIISIPMFNLNFNMQYDDGIQHICRLIGTEESIKDGQIFPVIISNFCNDFGYSWNLFYSPLTAYIPLIFRIFNLSFDMCLKIFILFISFFTGLSMYFYIMKITKKQNVAILAAILYVLVPYRLNDMYFRMAIPELVTFIFIPMIFNGLYTIIKLKKKTYLLVLGASLLVLTHSMITIYIAILCIIYLICNFKDLKKNTILMLFKDAIFILLITSFYTLPLLESKLSADYEVFNQEHMVRYDAMIALKPKIGELFIQLDGRMLYGLGIIVIVGTVFSIIAIKKVKDKKNLILFLVLGIICTIMALDIFPFEKMPKILTMMQFSFRMLEFASFFLVVVSAITLEKVIDKFNIYTVIFLTSMSILLLLPSLSQLEYGKYYNENDLKEGIKVTKNTGRVHAGLASFEYLPTKAFKNRSYIENRENKPIILQDNSDDYTIENYYKENTNCEFEIKMLEEKEDSEVITIELPYIYYIGYSAYIESENGNNEMLTTYESENGFLCIDVNLNTKASKIKVEYTGTLLMKISYIVSLLGIFVYILYNIYLIKYNNKTE